MHGRSFLFGLILLISTYTIDTSSISLDKRLDRSGLYKFITHPEIRAPKWTVNIHDPSLLSPGYWFLAPREPLGSTEQIGGWIGPAIYDQYGELIWSGAPKFRNTRVDDFRLSNVAGETLMTLIWDEHGAGVMMNSSYEIVKSREFTRPHLINMHEFHFVDEGRRAIVLRGNRTKADGEVARAVGIDDGVKCVADFDGFEEVDTTTWETTFKWSSFGRIGLRESMWTDERSVQQRCEEGWDFLHLNSVDKSKDGDFFVSARFTNTIYKVSKKDGSIVWRLGGVASDFDMGGLKFTGQHSVRYVSENETTTLITILDNAKIDDLPPTHDYSRGLLLALDTTASPMKVSVVTEYPHPHGPGGYAKARGNLQTLENGNVFIGWSERATQSEHLANGTLVMDAQLIPTWLGSYRNYKFPFVGKPRESAIAVVSVAHSDSGGTAITTVYVSWNGATEVVSWNLYDAAPEIGRGRLLNTTTKTGFETQILADQFASYVVLEAIDADGKVLGTSKVTYTEPPADQEKGASVMADDIKNMPPAPSAKISEDEQMLRSETSNLGIKTPYLAISVLVAAIVLLARIIVKRRKRLGRFGKVRSVRADDGEAEKAFSRSRVGSILKHRYKPSR